MQIEQAAIQGVYSVTLEPISDERGFFARSWCKQELRKFHLDFDIVQCNISHNHHAGTLRGMHYQEYPAEEEKYIRCTHGAIYDVVVDLRPKSPTYRRWVSFLLSASNYVMLYVPRGCAHGFLTMEKDTEVFYQMSQYYASEHACGVRWDDPAFGIQWPFPPVLVSEKDLSYGKFNG